MIGRLATAGLLGASSAGSRLATMGLAGSGLGAAYGGLKGLGDDELGRGGGFAFGAVQGAFYGGLAGLGLGALGGRYLGQGYQHGKDIASTALNKGDVSSVYDLFAKQFSQDGISGVFGNTVGAVGGYGVGTAKGLRSKYKGWRAGSKELAQAERSRELASGPIPSGRLGMVGTMALGTGIGGMSVLGAAYVTGGLSGDPAHPYNAVAQSVRSNRNNGIRPGQYGDTGDLVFAMNANRRGY